MTTVTFHNPTSVVLDHGTSFHWLTIYDGRGNQVSLHFGEEEERAHAFALAVLRAVSKPETVIDIMPKEEQ